MRAAELVMALLLGAVSIAFMVKSAELPIGYVSDEGPGAGAFPFWLGAGMLACCAWTVVRWMRRETPPARSVEPFMTRESLVLFVAVAGALGLMIGLIHSIGIYFSVPLFLLFYLRILGRHGWLVTLLITLLTPVIMFFFFEVALTITLPKGWTEPLFYPLYDWFL